MTTSLFILALIVAAFAGSVAPLAGQSAAEIVERMLAEYERRTEGVDDYTLVQTVMGFETVSYYEKSVEDGRPVFHLVRVSAGGMEMEDAGAGSVDEIYSMADELAENAQFLGREQVGGVETFVLRMDELQDSDLAETLMPEDGEFAPTGLRMYLDVETYAPRRMVFEGEWTNSEGAHPVTGTLDLGDYREIQGMLVAHDMVMTMEGMGAAIDEEQRAQFEQMQRELENMPPAQRQMVESMMGEQLEQFRAMMAGDDEPIVVEMRVTEVRVNTGPPGGE